MVRDRAAVHDHAREISECLDELEPKCRLLIEGAAQGLKPRELTRVLGWPEDWNKKASDDLRSCRQRLRQLLRAAGLLPDPGPDAGKGGAR